MRKPQPLRYRLSDEAFLAKRSIKMAARKVDAPFVMMLGVVGLGLFAIFRIFKTDGSKPQTTALP